MKRYKDFSYGEKIQLRIRALWAVIAAMLIYMVVVAELGGGDSRMMTYLAEIVHRLVFFGGMIYVFYRIWYYKKLLKDRLKLKEQLLQEQDERNQYIHDKSGGLVMDVLLVCLLFVTVTTALFNMAAFYTAFAILCVTVCLKLTAYAMYSRI